MSCLAGIECWQTRPPSVARQLLAFCRDLSEEQLAASATGTYGSIRATFNHLVLSDGRYLRRLAGGAPAWVDHPDEAELDELAVRMEEAGQQTAQAVLVG